ncbi:MAG: hypothetical protein ACI9W2_000054, partial [Gammaproteobacteria bacterium]
PVLLQIRLLGPPAVALLGRRIAGHNAQGWMQCHSSRQCNGSC